MVFSSNKSLIKIIKEEYLRTSNSVIKSQLSLIFSLLRTYIDDSIVKYFFYMI